MAVPTKAHAGLEDFVSGVFGKAKTFTIIDVENGEVTNVQVVDNPAASYDYGSGPIASKALVDLKVDFVVTGELGPGASGLLEQHNIKRLPAKPGMKVAEAIRDTLMGLGSNRPKQT